MSTIDLEAARQRVALFLEAELFNKGDPVLMDLILLMDWGNWEEDLDCEDFILFY